VDCLEVRFIENGTKMDIEVLSEGVAQFESKVFSGVYFGLHKDTSFYLSCDPLFMHSNKISRSCQLSFTFFRGQSVFRFKGRLIEATTFKDRPVLVIATTSFIDKSSRRKFPRMEISFPVSIIDKSLPKSDSLIARVTAFDMSKVGMCLLTNSRLNLSKDKEYFLEFLLLDRLFSISAHLVHDCNAASKSRSYKFSYGFAFSDKNSPEQMDNLVASMFDYKLQNV
jgi:hypothetical protein